MLKNRNRIYIYIQHFLENGSISYMNWLFVAVAFNILFFYWQANNLTFHIQQIKYLAYPYGNVRI